jgi:CRISPR/Cas system-associated endoribonuclease Cas2
MARYVICYDLRKPNYTEADYDELYSALDSIGAKHIQDSVWAVRLDEWSARDIYNHLWAHMHQPKDRLLVAECDGGFQNIHGITKFKDV